MTTNIQKAFFSLLCNFKAVLDTSADADEFEY